MNSIIIFFKKIGSYISAHKIISAIVLVAVVGAGYYGFQKTHASSTVRYVTQPASTQTITQTVSATGQVAAENKVNIVPQGSGQIVSISVKQGDMLAAGQTIATLDEHTASTAVAQARASLASAQANLATVQAGETPLDAQVNATTIASAQKSVDQAKTQYQNVVTQQQNAVSNSLTSMLNTGISAQPAITNYSTGTITIIGTYSGTAQGQDKITIGASGAGFTYDVQGLDTADGVITKGIPIAIGQHGLSLTFSTTGTFNINDSWTIAIPNMAATSYLGAYNSYQSALQSQAQALQNAQNSIDNAELSLQQANENVAIKEAPPTDQAVQTAQAQVTQAESSLYSAEQAYGNNIIKAPFAGQLATWTSQVGDQVSGSTTMGVLITPQQIATVSLNEVDVSKIKAGDKANITFDAIDGLNMTGTVGEIDTIGTVSQGVVSYAVTIGFDTQDSRVKPGMSANANIITNVVTDALTVPNAAVKGSGGAAYVQELDATTGKPKNVTVQVGISNDSVTQITSGISAGDEVVTQTISTAKTATASTGAAGLGGLTGAAGRTGAAGAFGGGGFTGGGARVGGGAAAGAGR